MNYKDPSCEGNGLKYRSGRTCIEKGCNQPAGTAWGPYWCVRHNIERMARIDRGLEGVMNGLDDMLKGGGGETITSQENP